MAPTTGNGRQADPRLLLCGTIHRLLEHPGVLFITTSILLGIWTARRILHAMKRNHHHQPWTGTQEDTMIEKLPNPQQSLSDLPPPLRSLVTSGSLAAETSPIPTESMLNDPSPAYSSAMGLWRRHSYTSPMMEIASDDTTLYPIIDNGERKPGFWRRRTLVFETTSAPLPFRAATYPLDATADGLSPLDNDADVNELSTHNTALGELRNSPTDMD